MRSSKNEQISQILLHTFPISKLIKHPVKTSRPRIALFPWLDRIKGLEFPGEANKDERDATSISVHTSSQS